MFQQGIFTDSMLEVSTAQRARRSWTTLTSFAIQALLMGSALLIPLLKTVRLPGGRVLPTPISWGAPPPPVRPSHPNVTTIAQSNLEENALVAPREIPHHIANIEETMAPPQVNYNANYNQIGIEGSTGLGSPDGAWKSFTDSFPRPILSQPPPAPSVRQFRTSHMLEGNLIHRVDPTYPAIARTARVQGQVVLSAVIGKDGVIENLHALSGHPMLVASAIEAVRQWRYRPYILNGDPIEVETQITVNFNLQ